MIPFRTSKSAGGLRRPQFHRLDAGAMPESEDYTSDPTRAPLAPGRVSRPASATRQIDAPGSPFGSSMSSEVERRAEPAGAIASSGRCRSIAIPMRVMAIVGDTAAGVLLSQLIYWTRRGVDVTERDGWIFKTAGEWHRETGMTWKVQRRARTLLMQLGLMEERKQQMPACLEFRLNLSALVPLLAQRAEVEADDVNVERFREAAADNLVGRAFLFHTPLMRLWPVHTAMMASRLLASARLPALDPQVLRQVAARLQDGRTKLLTLHRTEWHAETGLSRDHWQTARRNLLASGVLVERRHNFPRRVDMALNLRQLAELLRQSATAPGSSLCDDGDDLVPASTSYRLDRAKQVGGIGHHPIPPSQSPGPADRDRPILPIGIARSRLYPMGLQGSLHPQPQSARAEPRQDHPIPPSLALACGGGGFYGILKVQLRAAQPSAPQPASNPEIQLLAWPRLFTEADRAQAVRHLAGLDREVQQCVLDEIEWIQQSGKAIRSPVALARTLARNARGGAFVPDGAHRIAEARVSEAQRELKKRDAGAHPPMGTEQRAPLSPAALEARERVNKTREEMRRRSA